LFVPCLNNFLSFLNILFTHIFQNSSHCTLVTSDVLLVSRLVGYFSLNKLSVVLFYYIPDTVNRLDFCGLRIPTLDSSILLAESFYVASDSLSS